MQPLARDHDFAPYQERQLLFPRDGPSVMRIIKRKPVCGVLVRDCRRTRGKEPDNAVTPERYSEYIDALRGELAAMAQRPCFGGSPNAELHVQPTGALAVLMGAHKRLGAGSPLALLDPEILRLILRSCHAGVQMRMMHFQPLPDYGPDNETAWRASFALAPIHNTPDGTGDGSYFTISMSRTHFLAMFRWQAQVVEELQACWGETTVHVWEGELAWGRKMCFSFIRDAMRPHDLRDLDRNAQLLAAAVPFQRAHTLHLDSVWSAEVVHRLLPILVSRTFACPDSPAEPADNLVWILNVPKQHRPGIPSDWNVPSDWNADPMDCCNLTLNDMWLNLFVALSLIRMYGAEPYSVVVTNGALDAMQVKRMVANVFSTEHAFHPSRQFDYLLFLPRRSIYADTEDERRLDFSRWWGYDMHDQYALKHEDPEPSCMDEIERLLPTREEYASEFVLHHQAILADPAQDVRTAVRAACFMFQDTTNVSCEPNSPDERDVSSSDDSGGAHLGVLGT
jgi:hypothetical protein